MKNTIIERYKKTFIITDIEATCDDQNNIQSTFDRALSEPIEIGAVAVNENYEILGEFQTFIKPINYNTGLTPFCMSLTKIKQFDVVNALPNPISLEIFCFLANKFFKLTPDSK